MKKLMVYPYDKDLSSIARYKDMIIDYELVSIVALKGMNFQEKDASYVDGGKEIGLKISDSFEEEINKCDVVLFLYSDYVISQEDYEKKIELALLRKKEIIIQSSLEKKLKLKKEIKNKIQILEENPVDYKEKIVWNYRRGIIEISTPVILVFGAGIHCNKFEIQLSLRRRFVKDGYKVSQLGTKEFSKIFGFSSLPDFIYDSNIDFSIRILALNHYIYEMQINEKPDIFIIGMPLGIMPIDLDNNNRFGEMANIISSAVQGDIGIISMYFNEHICSDEFLEMSNHCKYNLHCETEYFSIANSSYSRDLAGTEKDKYITINNTEKADDIVAKNKEIFQKNGLNIYSVFNEADEKDIYENIINNLSENVVVI
ncbi:TIGR04066 family peptide maturation system protein [uncultured Clostridium sp.]|uniref:TIGR04066 family peptide maturation system protein n=1 Tax=uncultured Clostridium sp. TaxID=59620 RepID=UPI0028EE639A|nr:TIGR04066 family peptide maturation system protein [uncultured Clostridium sp.]